MDFTITDPPLIVSFTSFSGPLSNRTVEYLRNSSLAPEEFFEEFPITIGFYYCVLVDIINDHLIENPEEFTISVMTENENDVFEATNSSMATITVPIEDNNGMCLLTEPQ